MSHTPEADGKSSNPNLEIDGFRTEVELLRHRWEQQASLAENLNSKIDDLTQRLATIEAIGFSDVLSSHKEETSRQISELRTAQQTNAMSVPVHEHAEIRNDLRLLTTKTEDATGRLLTVENKLVKHEKGLVGFFQKAGIVIGVFGALLAGGVALLGLPKAVKEYQSTPQTKLVSSWPLDVSYDPTGKMITFVFSVSIANNGGKADTIKQARASFRADSVPLEQGQFFNTGLQFMEKGVEIHTPFEVGTSSPRELRCTLSEQIGNSDVGSIIKPGANRLHVDFIADDDKVHASADYCFFVASTHVKEFVAAKSVMVRSYANAYPGCDSKK